MDGLEIAATALSSTMTCPTCECPKDELARTDKLYPVRSTADVRTGVEKARAEFLERDGSIKDRCIGKVSYHILYHIWYQSCDNNDIHDMILYDDDIIHDII